MKGDTADAAAPKMRALNCVTSANAILARGEIVFGSELAAAKGSAMIDRALAKLKAAGYGQPGQISCSTRV